MIHMDLVAVLPDVRYRQRVQKRLTRLRKRLLAFVIKAIRSASTTVGGSHRLLSRTHPPRSKFAWLDYKREEAFAQSG